MSTHNICFCGELRKIPVLFSSKKRLIWSYVISVYAVWSGASLSTYIIWGNSTMFCETLLADLDLYCSHMSKNIFPSSHGKAQIQTPTRLLRGAACFGMSPFTYEPVHDVTYKETCVTSEDSDQTAHMCSLISLRWSHVPSTVSQLSKEG